jgi:hypothetical protein
VSRQRNYQRDLAQMLAAGFFASLEKGQLYQLDVAHDDECAIWKGGKCNCSPDYQLRKQEEVA